MYRVCNLLLTCSVKAAILSVMTETYLKKEQVDALSDTKCQKVRETLENSIRSGKFGPGTRLPGEREIAKSLKVSTMTVNRAISELVDSRWLERRARVGTFVHSDAWQNLGIKTLNLILPLYDSPSTRQFCKLGRDMAKARGFTPHEINVGKNVSEAVEGIMSGAYSIVFMPWLPASSPIAQAMKQANGRTVLISGRLDDLGIHSVMGDDRHMIRIGMAHLRQLGHKAIGLVCARRDNYVERERVAAWYACYDSDARDPVLQRRLMVLDLPRGEHPTDSSGEVIRSFLRSSDFDCTALICPDDETAMVLLSVCHDEGIRIPDDLSVISIGNTSYAELLVPRLTSLDPDLDKEIELALDLLLAEKKDISLDVGLLHAVEPKLVVRESAGSLCTDQK
jgi:GntR family transcriptional regulator of arabinose operon